MEESSYTTRGAVSTLRHRPHEFDFDEDKFGVVVCQGSNTLGQLDNPCVFTVTAAGKTLAGVGVVFLQVVDGLGIGERLLLKVADCSSRISST